MAVYSGSIYNLNDLKAEYQLVDKSIRIKVSPNNSKKITLVGNDIILNSKELIAIGTLIELNINLKNQFKHKINHCNKLISNNVFILLGQVLKILESRKGKYKFLIHVLD